MFIDEIDNTKKMVLHCCCAPCSCAIIDLLIQKGVETTLFFYNPNIHPEKEYLRRKEELCRYGLKRGVAVVDAEYDPDQWFEYVKGYEKEPERGERCTKCFYLRLLKTAEYAAEHGYPLISTTLGISRWKDFSQVTNAGIEAVSSFPNLSYIAYNWRKKGGTEKMHKITKKENFYRQTYCGCSFSKKSP